MVFAIGGEYNSYAILLLGRILFGLGGECMSVAQSAIVSVWFKGKELNLAMGLNISIARLASVANGVIVPNLYES